MRLTEAQLAAIRNSATKAFGEHAGVWLFGSRIDDTRRGGDIDLLVAERMINPEDLDLIQVIDEPEGVVEAIFLHYETRGFLHCRRSMSCC